MKSCSVAESGVDVDLEKQELSMTNHENLFLKHKNELLTVKLADCK
jgi:hypothetical protein